MIESSIAEQLQHGFDLGIGQSMAPQPCVLVIFGAAGDLSWRKLLPAVYNLNVDGVLPSSFAVVGFGLSADGHSHPDGDSYIRERARDGIERFSRQEIDQEHWDDFARALFFVEGSFNDGRAYELLKSKLDSVDQQFGIPASRVYYLSIPPGLVPMCVDHLREAGMIADPGEETGFSRVIVEKPIGHDLQSAREIIGAVARSFDERQTYRIDHYLGKETVQNTMVLRFANSIFEPLWNQKYIDHVQFTVAESEGLSQYNHETGAIADSRVGYYEGVGALRDMLQNHMLQTLCLVAMEPPYTLEADKVRDAKTGVLSCLRPMSRDDIERMVVRGQYIAGDEHGHPVRGYQDEVENFYKNFKHSEIPPESNPSATETYVAMKLFVDNWRWAGVPFYLRTGKRLPKRASEVAIQFRTVPSVLFNADPELPIEPTLLTIRIQPEEGLSMRIASKLPGPKVRIYPVKMEFNYSSAFGGTSPEAYERLLLDVMAGDATLFMRRDAVEAAWQFVMPILEHWDRTKNVRLPEYQAGTWGPREADDLIQADGREWRNL